MLFIRNRMLNYDMDEMDYKKKRKEKVKNYCINWYKYLELLLESYIKCYKFLKIVILGMVILEWMGYGRIIFC